jgi:type IV pilus assembly protein PilZ
MNSNISSNNIKPQTIEFHEDIQIYRCFLPFIENGGLFLPFNKDVTVDKIFPGQKMFIVVVIDNQKTPFPAHVVWINPTGRFSGYGIQFPSNNLACQKLVETISKKIEKFSTSKEITYTL